MKKYKSRTKIIIFACVVLILFIVGAAVFTYSRPNTVEKYDTVKIDYTVWESNSLRTYNVINPLLDTILWVTMVPITENDTTGLILGLYDNLLGKRVYYESDLIWLDACIDENRDGINDITNATALSYGNSTDQYYNTCLMIEFQVLDIEKGPETKKILFDWSGLAQFFQTFSEISYTIFKTIFVLEVILPILLLSTFILSVFIIDFIDRHQIRIDRVVFKYGLMIGFVCSILLIAIGLINISLSPPEFNLLISRYPFFLPLLIILLIVLCVVSIVVYLILYKIIESKIKNSTTQSKSKVEQLEKVIERQEPQPIIQKVSQKTHQKKKKKKQKREKPRNLYFIHKHGLYILLTTVINFLMFIAFWTSIPEFQVLLEYQLVIAMIAIGLFIYLIFGLFYYRSFPTLEVWKLTRIVREFNKLYPKRIYKNPTERIQVLTGYIQSKYPKDPNEGIQGNYSKNFKDIDLIRKFGKFTKDNIILSCILICISIILAIIWMPLFLMHYLERWALLATNLWVYPVTWVLIALVIIDLFLLMQKNVKIIS